MTRTVTLSRPQLNALRQVRSRLLYAADVNRGNVCRTYASLFKLGLIDWDPIYRGHVQLTKVGEQALDTANQKERDAKIPSILRAQKGTS